MKSRIDFESGTLEFKRELSESVDLEKEVVAFLNSAVGGRILIGVDDNGRVVGLADADADALKIKDRLKSNIQPSILGLFDLNVLDDDGKRYLELIVAGGCERPYYKTKFGMTPKGCYRRIGTAAEPMSVAEIDTMFAKRARNSLRHIPSPRSLPHDFSTLKISYQEHGFEVGDRFLENLELHTPDGKPNYVAYLLADENAVSMRVAKYAGTDKCNLIENNEYGYTCVLRALQKVLDKIDVENRTMTRITGKAERDQKRMYDPIAIREAVTNAVLHTDWTREISPIVEIYSDRIEITSCGGLPDGLTKDEFLRGRSVPRNRELMRIFRDLELAEQLGSGMRRILKTYSPDIFEISENFITVVLHGDRNDFNASGGVAQKKKSANLEAELCQLIMDNEAIKQHEMASMLCVSVRTVSRLCAKLTADGKLSRKGSDWVLRNEVALKNGVVGVSNGVVGVAHERKNDAKGRKMAVRSEDIARLRAALKDALKCVLVASKRNEESIIERYLTVFDAIAENEKTTFNAIFNATGIPVRTISLYVSRMTKLGFLRRIGGTHGGSWEICYPQE